MPKTKKGKMRVTFAHCPMDHCPVLVARAREMFNHYVCKYRVPTVMVQKHANVRVLKQSTTGSALGIAKKLMGWVPHQRYYY